MKKFRQKKYFLPFLFLLFFVTRVFFINPQEVFFDSGEYLHLFSQKNYLYAITAGHFPPHEGYIVLFWPIYQAAKLFTLNAAYTVIIFQIILSFFTLYFFYQFIAYIIDKKTAFITTIIASITPLFWIINVTIMMENAYAFFFFLSLFLLIQYLKTKKQYLLHLTLISLSLAVLTQTMTILWAPILLYTIFLKSKNELIKIFLLLCTYIFVFSIINIFFISSILSMHPLTVFNFLYLSKGGEFAEIPFSIKGLLVALRNFSVPLLQNNTILINLLSFISLFVAFKHNKKIFLLGLLFILPALYTNQWWDSLLNGRHALLADFGLAFMVGYLLRRKNILYFLFIICYIIWVSVPALTLLKKPIPYLVEAQYVATLPKGSFIIESHFARPQVQETIKGTPFYVNEPGYDVDTLDKKINTYLAEKKPIFISSAALSEPYGLYSGPYLHNITLSYEFPFLLQTRLANYTVVQYKIINAADNLLFYKITAKKKAPYPTVKNMKDSYRRLDYADPFWQLTWWLEKNFIKSNFTPS